MATALKLEEPSTELVVPSAELVVAEPSRGDVVLFNREAFDQFEAKLRENLKDFVPDLSTAAGRKAIASKAFEVTKVKTTLEKQAKALTEEWRTKTSAVNAGRNVIVGRLEALADEVRKPLTEWEEAEKTRVAECRMIIDNMRAAATVTIDDTAAAVRERGSKVFGQAIDPERFGDMADEALTVKAATVEALKAALVRLTREEAEREELAKLRAANEAREAEEAAKREAEERVEAKRCFARQTIAYIKDEVGNGTIGGKPYPYIILIRELEEKIVASEDDYGDMAGDVETARRETLDRVLVAQREEIERRRREDQEQAAEAERQRLQREHEEELAAERRRAEEAEAAAQAERDRAAAEERARKDAKAEEAEAERQRESDKAALRARKTETKLALMGCGASEEVAQKIVTAIRAGDVANLEWKR